MLKPIDLIQHAQAKLDTWRAEAKDYEQRAAFSAGKVEGLIEFLEELKNEPEEGQSGETKKLEGRTPRKQRPSRRRKDK